jgi:hypothetical protein
MDKFMDYRVSPYSDKPKQDVEVLDEPFHCRADGEVITLIQSSNYDPSKWVHEAGVDCTSPWPRPKCAYCGTDEVGVVVDRQHAYHDARECSRCGGVTGFAIGD